MLIRCDYNAGHIIILNIVLFFTFDSKGKNKEIIQEFIIQNLFRKLEPIKRINLLTLTITHSAQMLALPPAKKNLLKY